MKGLIIGKLGIIKQRDKWIMMKEQINLKKKNQWFNPEKPLGFQCRIIKSSEEKAVRSKWPKNISKRWLGTKFQIFVYVVYNCFFYFKPNKVLLNVFLLNIMKIIERNNTISISKQVLNECNAVYYFRVSHNFDIFR